MANIKFSQFTVETAKADVDFLVGYSGPDNVQISPTNLLADYPAGSGAAGQVTFFSAASTVTGDNDFYWDNTNKRLGVGTTTPDRKFEVESTGTGEMCITGATGSRLYFRPTGSYSPGGNFGILVTGSGGPSYLSTMTITGYNNGLNTVMTLKGDGNVGIGTASPSAKLEVDGTLIATGISQLGSGGSNVLLTSSSAGNVGIGTTSPGVKLDVFGSDGIRTTTNSGALTDGYFAQLRSDYGSNALRLTSRAGDVFRATDFGQAVSILTGTTSSGTSERLHITKAGNVGIGTNGPEQRLHVASVSDQYIAKFSHSTATGYAPGSILLEAGQGDSRGQGIFHYNNVADDSWFTGVPYNVSSTKWIVSHKPDTTFNPDVAQLSHAILTIDSSNDNVGIGTTSPAYKLDVSGSLRATGESTFTNNLLFPDNSRIKLGTGEDLQIYHDGSNSYIQDASGTGDIRIASNIVHLNNAASTEVMLKAIENGAVELYYNDNKKLETTTDGATILGGTGVNTLSRLRVGGEGAGNNKSILELVEHIQGTDMHYGFSFTCDGDGSNNLLLRRHQNSVTGSTVMTVNRGDDNVTFEGDVEIANSSNGIILESPDGTRYRVTVANGGTLSVSAV